MATGQLSYPKFWLVDDDSWTTLDDYLEPVYLWLSKAIFISYFEIWWTQYYNIVISFG